MTDPLHLGAHERITVVSTAGTDPDAESLVVRAEYRPGGGQPPAHLHPGQDETFEIHGGTLRVEVDGEVSDHPAGGTLTIGRGRVHRMWNAGSDTAEVTWTTTPALDTERWFRGIDALQRAAEQRGGHRPSLLGFAAHAARHRDTFRLVLRGSRPLGTLVTSAVGTIGRLLGR